MNPNDPLTRLARPLAAALIAVVISMVIAAFVGGAMPFDYEGRAWVYTGCVIYVVAGAVVVFRTVAGAEAPPLSAGYILKWTLSLWIWPALLPRRRR